MIWLPELLEGIAALERVTVALELFTDTILADVSRRLVWLTCKLEFPEAIARNMRVKTTPSPEIPGAYVGRDTEMSMRPPDGSTR